jgi:heptaprenyl diphosphate synthase
MEELPEDHIVRRIIRREPHSKDDLTKAIRAVNASSGIFRSYAKAREMIVEGMEFLMKFGPGPYRDVLADMAYYIVDRGFLKRES